jgi:hypothetical protein
MSNAVRTFAVAPGLKDVGVVPGGVWVTVGAGPGGPASTGGDVATGSRGSTRAIGTATCSPIYYGAGRRPDVLVSSDLPLQGAARGVGSRMAAAIKLILRQNGFRAGRYAVGYQSCDDATVNTFPGGGTRCANNANGVCERRKPRRRRRSPRLGVRRRATLGPQRSAARTACDGQPHEHLCRADEGGSGQPAR